MGSWWRQTIRRIHLEGIPWPASLLYNAVSGADMFRRHYGLVAEDVVRYGKARHILDVGTGPGRLLPALHRWFPEASLVGVDISAAMVARARRNMEQWGKVDAIELKVAAADNLPFADDTFDRLISTGSLHHWKHPRECMAEGYRVLKPGGYALHYDLVRQMPEAVSREIRTRFGGFRFGLLWLHSFEEPFLNADEMEVLGENSAFSVEGTYFVGALCCLVLRKT